MKRVFVAGEILVEVMADTIGAGFCEPLALTGPFPSGAPAIFADQVGQMNHPVSIASCVGDDDFGRLNLRHLEGHGVDVSAIQIDADRPTGSAFVRYRPDGARDFVFNIAHSASGAFTPDATTQAQINASSHMHIVGSSLTAPAYRAFTVQAAQSIKAQGGTISFDPNIRKELLHDASMKTTLQDILMLTDLFLPSDAELSALVPGPNQKAALDHLLDQGVRTIVHKNGKSGASLYERGVTLTQAAYAVKEVDPTGAGDCFGAVFTVLWLQGYDRAEALRLAAAAGALAVTKRGPMSGNSDFETLRRFVEKGKYDESQRVI